MQSWPKNQHMRLEKVFWLFFGIGILVILAVAGPIFLQMRPVADDYCFAASLDSGFPAALSYWYENVQFDFFVLTSNLLFVALPIQILPTSSASMVTFVVTVLIFAFFVSRLFSIGRIRDSRTASFKNLCYWFFSIIAFFYLQSSFLNTASALVSSDYVPWTQYIAKIVQHTNDVANSWAFWGVVNSSYLIPFVLSFLYLSNFQVHDQSKRKWRLLLSILVGGTGYVIASTTFFTLAIISYIQIRSSASWSTKQTIRDILKTVTIIWKELFLIVSGVMFSFFSSGGISRRSTLQDIPASQKISLDSMVGDVAIILAEVFLNLGNLFAIIFGIFIAISLKGDSDAIRVKVTEIFRTSRVYLFVCFFMTVISEIFSYRAYWHTFTLRFVFLIFLVSFVVLFIRRKSRLNSSVAYSVLITPALIVFSIFGLAQQTNARFDAWSLGENFGALSSLSSDSGWVNDCFRALRDSEPLKFYPELNK